MRRYAVVYYYLNPAKKWFYKRIRKIKKSYIQ